MLVSITFMGDDFIADVDYDVTCWGHSRTVYVDEEALDWRVASITLSLDLPGCLGPAFEATGALFKCLAKLPEIEDAIREDAAETGPYEGPDYDPRHDYL